MTQELYVHGYSEAEQERLRAQAQFLASFIFSTIDFSGCQTLLEIGCGVGAQTEILLSKFPQLKITSIDISAKQIEAAKKRLGRYIDEGRLELQVASGENLPFKENSFDGIFLCWVLEHIKTHVQVLKEARRVLTSTGKIVCNEVHNSTFYISPNCSQTMLYWQAMNELQRKSGDPDVGLKLGNLLSEAGFNNIQTLLRPHHYDRRTNSQLKSILEYWLTLLLSTKDQLLDAQMVFTDTIAGMTKEFKALQTNPNAVFFFQAIQAHATKN